MNDKSGNYGLLFRVLADAQDWYASREIPYVTPPINNTETAKEQEALSLEFLWKNNSPVIIGLYCPKPNNVLLVLTAYGEPDICDAPHKKPMVIEICDNQGSVVDIINQILCNYFF